MTAELAPQPHSLLVRKAAVLGAGTMGARIAAHLANAGVDVVLLDLPSAGAVPSAIAAKALEGLKKEQAGGLLRCRRGRPHRARQLR